MMYRQAEQKIFMNRFEKGDLNISVCRECLIYFKQPLMPRDCCTGCYRGKSTSYKQAQDEGINRFRGLERKGDTETLLQERESILKTIRENTHTIPRLIQPIRKVEVAKIKRICLACPKQFFAESKFQRLCEACRCQASNTGMDEWTHYYGGGEAS